MKENNEKMIKDKEEKIKQMNNLEKKNNELNLKLDNISKEKSKILDE